MEHEELYTDAELKELEQLDNLNIDLSLEDINALKEVKRDIEKYSIELRRAAETLKSLERNQRSYNEKVKNKAIKEKNAFLKSIKVKDLKKIVRDADKVEAVKDAIKRKQLTEILEILDLVKVAQLYLKFTNKEDALIEDKYLYFSTSPLYIDTYQAIANINTDKYELTVVSNPRNATKREFKTQKNIDGQLLIIFTNETEKNKNQITITTPGKLNSNGEAKKVFRIIMQNIFRLYDKENGILTKDEVFISYNELVENGIYKSVEAANHAFNTENLKLIKSIEIDAESIKYGKLMKSEQEDKDADNSKDLTDAEKLQLALKETGELATVEDHKNKKVLSTSKGNRSYITGYDTHATNEDIRGGALIYLERRAAWNLFFEYYVFVPVPYFNNLSLTAQDLLIAIFTRARTNGKSQFNISYRDLMEYLALPNENTVLDAKRSIIDAIDRYITEIAKTSLKYEERSKITITPYVAASYKVIDRINNSYIQVVISEDYMQKSQIYDVKTKHAQKRDDAIKNIEAKNSKKI